MMFAEVSRSCLLSAIFSTMQFPAGRSPALGRFEPYTETNYFLTFSLQQKLFLPPSDISPRVKGQRGTPSHLAAGEVISTSSSLALSSMTTSSAAIALSSTKTTLSPKAAAMSSKVFCFVSLNNISLTKLCTTTRKGTHGKYKYAITKKNADEATKT